MNKIRWKIAAALTLSFILTVLLSNTVFSNPASPTLQPLLSLINQLFPQKLSKSTPPLISVMPSPIIIPSSPPTLAFLPSILPTKKTIIVPTNPPTQTPIAPTASYQCPNTSNNTYQALSVNPPKTANPQAHPDINLHIRGYQITNAAKSLIELTGATDTKAPQLTTLLEGNRSPTISNTYQVYDWHWSNNSKGGLIRTWDVTMVGLSSSPGQTIKLPNSGYDIGGGQALVLFAEYNTLTLKYTREDNVVSGYTIHLDEICVDPNLLVYYQRLDNQGRNSLPALKGGETIGKAKSAEVKVAIRDSGNFMDPRSRKDWWAR